MNARDVPVWVWVIGFILVMRVIDDLGSIIPLVVIGFVLWKLYSTGRLRASRSPESRQLPPAVPGGDGPPGPQGAPYPSSTHPSTGYPPTPPTGTTSPPPGSAGGPPPPAQMPRIDVPTYPGAAPAPAGGGAMQDPAVTLGLLQIAQAGRDLQEARGAGHESRVAQVAGQLEQAVDRVLEALSLSAQQGRETRRLRTALVPLKADAAVAARPGAGADAAVLDRLTTRALSIGQTGPHE